MGNSDKNKKIIKVVGIVLVVVFVILVALALFSKRPQNAGTGTTSIQDYNARIDYHDEMNCHVGDKKDKGALNVSATDGWTKISIENYELNGEKVTIHVVDDSVYLKSSSEKSIYSLEYFNKANNVDLYESLKLSEDDSRKIYCYAQSDEKYQIEKPTEYKNLIWKTVQDEEAN